MATAIDDEYKDLISCMMKVIANKYYYSEEDVKALLKHLSPKHRKAIFSEDGRLLGLIGIYNVDSKKATASIAYDLMIPSPDFEYSAFFEKYKKALANDGIIHIESVVDRLVDITKKKEVVEEKPFIIVPNGRGVKLTQITKENIRRYREKYSLPKDLLFPFVIESNNLTLGVIGLRETKNITRSIIGINPVTKQSADLCLYFNEDLGEDAVKKLSADTIIKYVNYAQDSDFHNIGFTTKSSDKKLIGLAKKVRFTFLGEIPYGTITTFKRPDGTDKKMFESLLMFELVKGQEWKRKSYFEYETPKPFATLGPREKLSDTIEINPVGSLRTRMVSVDSIEKQGLKIKELLKGYTKDPFVRDCFPREEKRNEAYVILTEDNRFVGLTNFIRIDDEGYNMELRVSLQQSLCAKGLEHEILIACYDELFSKNVATVFSEMSREGNPLMNEAYYFAAILRGYRVERCIVDGKVCDSLIYSRSHEKLDPDGREICR